VQGLIVFEGGCSCSTPTIASAECSSGLSLGLSTSTAYHSPSMWMRVMTPTTLRIHIQALSTSRSGYIRNWISDNRSHVRFIGDSMPCFLSEFRLTSDVTAGAASTIRVPTMSVASLAQTANNVSPLTRLDTLPSNFVRSIGVSPPNSLRSQRFEQTLKLVSTCTYLNQTGSKNPFPQVRSSAWLYLFNLATCPEQLVRASSKFLQFVEIGRKWRHEHINAFVRA